MEVLQFIAGGLIFAGVGYFIYRKWLSKEARLDRLAAGATGKGGSTKDRPASAKSTK